MGIKSNFFILFDGMYILPCFLSSFHSHIELPISIWNFSVASDLVKIPHPVSILIFRAEDAD